MDTVLDILWTRTWWAFAGAEDPIHAWVYRGINLVEGVFWLGFALLVCLRRAKQPAGQRSRIEIVYALAFVVFALTDFREAVALQSWLIWLKLVNLIVLLVLRHRVIRSLYPESKLY
ncbi:hypothetical protein OT109_05835 [Phycisphaeraceae bacterium D3-23]